MALKNLGDYLKILYLENFTLEATETETEIRHNWEPKRRFECPLVR